MLLLANGQASEQAGPTRDRTSAAGEAVPGM